MYVRVGLENGRYKYCHVGRPCQMFTFSEGSWYLWSGLAKCYRNSLAALGLPTAGWELCSRGQLPEPRIREVGEAQVAAADPETFESSSEGKAAPRGGGERPPGTSLVPAVGPAPAEQAVVAVAEEMPSSLNLTKGSRLAGLVTQGCIGLVRSSYFEDCMHYKRPLAMRQAIPSIHMWNSAEALRLWKKHGKCFLCVVSYSWLSRQHPDPQLFHLTRLVRVLGEYKRLWGMQEVAVIIDFCSLWQQGPGERDPRSEEQREQFAKGLSEISVPFGHKAVTSIKLMDVPTGERRQYGDRGWTLFESIVMDSKAGDWNRWVFSAFDPEIEVADAYAFFAGVRPGRLLPPLSPHRFKEELERRRRHAEDHGAQLFAQAKDRAVVSEKYREALWHICQSTKLAYCGAGWGDAEAELLAEVLPDCQVLERLHLPGNAVGAAGAAALARTIPKLRSLRQLVLKGNPLCSDSNAKDMLRRAWRFESKPPTGLVF